MKKLWTAAISLAIPMLPLTAHGQYHSWSFEYSYGPQVVSVSEFDEPLAEYGHWTDTPEYGRVWQPYDMPVGWRPYSDDGRWVWTDCGWYWESYRPWGWACFHYGNWVCTPYGGWCWVPGVVWSPAWVTWRECDDYIGWAPCPPAGFHVFFGASAYCDPGIRFVDFVFVGRSRFCDPISPAIIVAPENNVKIVNKTVNITKIKTVNHIVINRGPQVARIESVTHQRIERQSLRDLSSSWERPQRNNAEPSRASAPRNQERVQRQAVATGERSATVVRSQPRTETARTVQAQVDSGQYRQAVAKQRDVQAQRYPQAKAAPVYPPPQEARPQATATENSRRSYPEYRSNERDASSWARSVDASRSKRYAPSAEQIYTGPYVPDRLQAQERRGYDARGERQSVRRGEKSGNEGGRYGY